MLQDSFHDVSSVVALAAQTLGGDGVVNGVGIDLTGIQSVTWHVPQGAYTDGTHALSVEEADSTSGPWTAVTSDFTLVNADTAAGARNDGVIDDAAHDGLTHKIGYNGVANAARLVITSTSVTSGVTLDATLAMLGDLLTAPPADSVPAGETD